MGESNDWIEWNGGEESPVPWADWVDVKCRDGEIFTHQAADCDWRHRDDGVELKADIVAYRVIRPD